MMRCYGRRVSSMRFCIFKFGERIVLNLAVVDDAYIRVVANPIPYFFMEVATEANNSQTGTSRFARFGLVILSLLIVFLDESMKVLTTSPYS